MKLHYLFMLFVSLVATTSAFSGTKTFDTQMQKIIEPYLEIQTLLAADKTEAVSDLAQKIVSASQSLDTKSITGEHAAHFKDIPSNINKAAKELAKAKDLDSARSHFKKMSQAMAMWAGMSKPNGIDVKYCPMAKASWLQKSGKVQNPYYGQKMLSCGETVK